MPSFWTFDPSWLSDATRVGWMLGGSEGRMRRSVAERRVKTWGSYRHSVHPPTQWSLCPTGGLGRRKCLQGENRIPLSPVGSGSPQLPWLRSLAAKDPPQSSPLLLSAAPGSRLFITLRTRRRQQKKTLNEDERLQTYLVTGCSADRRRHTRRHEDMK